MSEYARALAQGLQTPSKIQQGLTTSAMAEAQRDALDYQKERQEFNKNLEIAIEAGIVRRDGKRVVVTENAIENLGKLSAGNRDAVSNALGMNEMMGSYNSEKDGKLIKKKNRQVYAPTAAKDGAIPTSLQNAFDNEEDPTKKAALQTEIDLYKAGKKKAYVTPAINQEGRFSLLNLFGTDKPDDTPMVYTEKEINAGLLARADKFNIDGARLFPEQYRELRRLDSTGEFGISNLGGGTDQSYIELVNGVFDEEVGRGTTNAFLKNLEKMYDANPRYYADTVTPASELDPDIEAGSEQDVDVTTPGAAKTFEQAYPSLQGLDGERLATELENLQEGGQLDQFSEQQITQIFTDLKNEGIGSVPDLIKKRSEQKKSVQEQYKEVLYLNTVAARPGADGKLVLPNGKTPKEATDEMINAYYTGIPDGDVTAKDLATSQDNRRTNILAEKTEETSAAQEKRLFYTAMTTRMKNQDESALEWRKQLFEEKEWYFGVQDEANERALEIWNENQETYKNEVNSITTGDYAGGLAFTEAQAITRRLMQKPTQIEKWSAFFRNGFKDGTEEDVADSLKVRAFQNQLNSIGKNYYNNERKSELGKKYVEGAKEAFLAIAGDDKEHRANLEKMWNEDGHNIYAYNYAQPAGFLEHKFMQEEFILQKVLATLENDESFWNGIFGLLPIVGESFEEYLINFSADDAKTPILLNSLKDSLAVVYEDGNPVRIAAVDAGGKELEESITLRDLVKTQGVSGLEYNWLIENLRPIGNTQKAEDSDGEG